MKLDLSKLSWSFLEVAPGVTDDPAGFDLLRVFLQIDPDQDIDRSFRHLDILPGTRRPLITAHKPDWAIPALLSITDGQSAVAVFEDQALGISGLPSFRKGALRVVNAVTTHCDPRLFEGLLRNSGILLSACLIAYSLSQVNWQNLNFSQSMASLALCGLGLDPNLATA